MPFAPINIAVLGFVASGKRTIKPLGADARLFELGRVQNNQEIKVYGGNTYQTLDIMATIAKRDAKDLQKLAQKLKANNLVGTLRNNWTWLYEHVDYKLDTPGTEQVRTPLRLIKDAYGDCDCFATFLSALLTAQGINHALRMTKYKGDWQHVYVVVAKDQHTPKYHRRQDYFTLDCVLDRFDQEEPFTQKYDKIMNIAVLSGLGAPPTASATEEKTALLQYANKHQNQHPELAQQVRLAVQLWDIDPAQSARILQSIENKVQAQLQMQGLSGQLGKTIFRKALDTITSIPKAAITVAVTPVKAAVNVVKAATDGDKSTTAKTAIVSTVQDTRDKLVEYAQDSPLAVLGRNGYLVILQNNIGGHSQKLAWGLMSEEQFRRVSDDIDFYNKSKESLRRVEEKWVKLGGSVDSLHANIKQGFNRKIRKGKIAQLTEELKGLGLDPASEAALISAGAGVAAMIGALIDKKLDKEPPYKEPPVAYPMPPPPSNSETKQGLSTATMVIGGIASVATIAGVIYTIRNNKKRKSASLGKKPSKALSGVKKTRTKNTHTPKKKAATATRNKTVII